MHALPGITCLKYHVQGWVEGNLPNVLFSFCQTVIAVKSKQTFMMMTYIYYDLQRGI